MSNRYTLTAKIERLRAGLAKAERDTQLAAAGIASSDLHSLAEQRIDTLIAEIDQRVAETTETRPQP